MGDTINSQDSDDFSTFKKVISCLIDIYDSFPYNEINSVPKYFRFFERGGKGKNDETVNENHVWGIGSAQTATKRTLHAETNASGVI